jgi:transcriptional regulator with XRE-family HTH domain
LYIKSVMKKARLSHSQINLTSQLTGWARRVPLELGEISPGNQILLIRTRLGLSQEQLARRAGMTRVQLGRIESGRADPRLSSLHKLFNALLCGLVILPRAGETLERVVAQRADALARKQIDQVLGTMALEAQPVSPAVKAAMVREAREAFIRNPSSALWRTDDTP